jgi:FtsP/CotA-like multicopper oxidase with cupredoxin domain
VVLALALLGSGCAGESGQPATPLIPGTEGNPREVNLIARDYAFVPPTLELVPGETVLLHVVNAGLVVHEAVIGDAAVQDVWEVAEAAVAGAPPGPTPMVSVSPELAGIRVVVRSGERVDITFRVPDPGAPAWIVGCHIPGHFSKGMQVPVTWVTASPAPPGG